MRVLITGGTGTIGKELVRQLTVQDVIIFSRNEYAQVLMKQEYPNADYIIGDVRDYDDILKATVGVNQVFHLAAVKHVDICEDQPQEAVKTNVIGTLNVVRACERNRCGLVSMSSDKAINPCNTYGLTKRIGEDMVVRAGFTAIRSGNVLWSSGSVLPIWKRQLETSNLISLTSKEMTRFFISQKDLVQFIINRQGVPGVHTIPMKSFRLYDIAMEFINRYGNEESEIKITSIREGERLHEFRDDIMSSQNYLCNDLNYIFQ